jgi:hypothetical protein
MTKVNQPRLLDSADRVDKDCGLCGRSHGITFTHDFRKRQCIWIYTCLIYWALPSRTAYRDAVLLVHRYLSLSNII